MDQVKEITDLLGEYPTVLKILSNLASKYPAGATVLLAFLLILLLIQLYQSFRVVQDWLKDGNKRWLRWFGVVGGAVVVLIGSYVVVRALAEAELPRPIPIQPGRNVHWGRRIMLHWEIPDDLPWKRFQVAVRQDERTILRESNRNQLPLVFKDCHLDEGSFDWRVRSMDGGSWSKWQRVHFYRDRLSRIAALRKLYVGLFADELPPYAYTDAETGAIDGVEPRIARLLARELSKLPELPAGIEPEFVRSEWLSGNVQDLHRGSADIVLANTTRSGEREQKYNILFSSPYLRTRLAFVWKRAKALSGWNQLVDRRVAIWEDSTAHKVLAQLSAAPRHYWSTTEMFLALDNEEIDAVLDDEHVMKCEIKKAAPDSYQLELFDKPPTMTLPFVYPEEISAYVANDGSSTVLLERVDGILANKEVQKEIEDLVRTFIENANCSAAG